MKIRDLVAVRSHPTVVRLDHLAAEGAQWITDAYHITADIQQHHVALRHALRQPSGCGAFLIGHYGSGKSHFLAHLVRELEAGRFLADGPQPRAISLLNYAARMPLEDIVCAALDLPAPGKQAQDRRMLWSELMVRYPRGLVLILDELSEFLRSKADARAFNEDIRFLQYLGEWAQGARLWVVAALQEQIEHTGGLEQAHYRKIKDRYPLRLMLSPAHVRDLVANSILIKQPGYDEAVGKLIARVREALPGTLRDTQTLAQTYPLHPITLDMLEEVRDRFSQTRGVVDFVVSQFEGRPERSIAPFAERPWGEVIGPDAIVTHFRDLFEVQPEFLPLAQRLLPYYERELPALFERQRLRDLAQRVLDLLILAYLSPARDGITAGEAAAWLLFAPARLDPKSNFELIERVLRGLSERGRYVKREGARYRLDLADDGLAALERLLERTRAELRGRGSMLFEMIAPSVAEAGDTPLALPRGRWQSRQVTWQFHERSYALYLGNETDTPGALTENTQEGDAAEACRLCIRLPWDDPKPITQGFTIVPPAIQLSDDVVELAALMRLREQPLTPEAEKRLEQQLGQRLRWFGAEVRSAYQAATLVAPGGASLSVPTRELSSLDGWLDQQARAMFARLYPKFEHYAPSHGPLAKETYRRVMRQALGGDLGADDADEAVRLACEAYLVPMGLLRRHGRQYVAAGQLERHPLVRLVLNTLPHQPDPKTVYEHLAAPVYGLVNDQIHLLLLFLLIHGELDLIKDKRVYREIYETFPLPLAYDRVVAAHGLAPDLLRGLQHLCEALRISAPREWTVLAQRRCVQQLREAGRKSAQRLHAMLQQLGDLAEARGIADRIGQVLVRWTTLAQTDGELQAFEQFSFEVSSAEAFVQELGALDRLTAELQSNLGELRRLRHLLSHPAVLEWMQSSEQEPPPGPPPGLDDAEAMTRWIGSARDAYRRYQRWYASEHDTWWKQHGATGALQWEPPRIAQAAAVGLKPLTQQLEACRQRALATRCRGLADLDYQPVCHCGFDGKTAPFAEPLERADELRRTIESQLRLFFQQASVKKQLHRWNDEAIERTPELLAYLRDERPYPEVQRVSLLERHLAGLDLVRTISLRELAPVVGRQSWEPAALAQALGRWLTALGADRVRFVEPDGDASTSRERELSRWCLEQALRHGAALPPGCLDPVVANELAEQIDAAQVSPAALAGLDGLGLPDPLVERILSLVADGQLSVAHDGQAPLAGAVGAARELAEPSTPCSVDALASLSARLYEQHQRIVRLRREPWLARLEALALSALSDEPPSLVQVLRAQQPAQWILVDALGLPLRDALFDWLQQRLTAWQVKAVGCARVATPTTTAVALSDLAGEGINHPIDKIDVLDRLLHERFVPLADLLRLALAELELVLKPIVRRLDARRPLFVFADHGFRIAAHGGSYTHGGASTLEQVVPTLLLEPRVGGVLTAS